MVMVTAWALEPHKLEFMNKPAKQAGGGKNKKKNKKGGKQAQAAAASSEPSQVERQAVDGMLEAVK